MCGIIGYIGERDIVPLLIDGLKKLEYRGYDSSGICVVSDKLQVAKKKGRITELEQTEVVNFKGERGIAHTRWATHGEPNDENSHPHISGDIAVVHNGIIENFHSLKELLIKEGYKFQSDTDTEVLAHLINKFYVDNLEDAVIKTIEVVEGAFGLAAIAVKDKDENIVAARRGSPLIIGVGEGEMFIASDVPAILKYTKKVVYLNDNELVTISKNSYSIKNLEGVEIPDREVHEIKWSAEQIEKGNYKHFMLKEINEQPSAILNTLRGRIHNNKIKLSVDIDAYNIKKIIMVACGTSWHSALIGKTLIEKLAKIPVQVDYASEFRYRDPLVDEQDLVIAISQSGETADTLAALKEAKSKGSRTLGIVNVVGSTITREVDSGIHLHAGPEIGVASTKAFTGQVTALTLLALYLQQIKFGEADQELIEELKLLPEKIKQVLSQTEKIRDIAETYTNATNFLYLGRGVNFPVALEGALKLKEISYIHAEGYPAAEMKHGPIALIDENMPAFFIAPKDETYEKILSNIEELKARKGKIIAAITEEEPEIMALADHTIKIPETRNELSPLITSIPLQLFAYHVADLKNLDVDKPRNLAKAVTVE